MEKEPFYPDSYQVSYNYSLPYTTKIQPHGIRYPVTFWRDHHKRWLRMDTYGGVNSMILKHDIEYEVVPRMYEQHCFAWKIQEDEPKLFTVGVGPLGAGADGDNLLRALPDVRGWAYGGEDSLEDGRPAQLWVHELRHEGKHLVYKFYAAADGTPLRLHMHGRELFDGAHFDEYIVDYYDYRPGRPDPEAFKCPKLCKGIKPVLRQGGARSARSLRMATLAPAVHYGADAQYDAFLATWGRGRQLRSVAEYRLRAEVYRANAALIAAHNAGNHSFTMLMNRFGDWTREEFIAIMLPNRARQQRQPKSQRMRELQKHDKYELPYKPLADPSRVPTSVDWRGTGADGTVKDQANCGSCWAFGATGAMEAAWFVATGQSLALSEQQLMDCSWEFGINKACDGGDAEYAVAYVAESGGAVSLPEYEYEGQDGFCRDGSAKRAAKFKGYARIPRYDDAALKEAVYLRGPVSVAIDASQPSFAFYSGGVYFDPACQYKVDDLDHAVVLSGYGTDEKQGDYWLVKNSWSEYWGDKGYIKISRDNHGCGVATDATYAVVDDSAL